MCTRKELKLSVSTPKRLKRGVYIRLDSFLALELPGGGAGCQDFILGKGKRICMVS